MAPLEGQIRVALDVSRLFDVQRDRFLGNSGITRYVRELASHLSEYAPDVVCCPVLYRPVCARMSSDLMFTRRVGAELGGDVATLFTSDAIGLLCLRALGATLLLLRRRIDRGWGAELLGKAARRAFRLMPLAEHGTFHIYHSPFAALPPRSITGEARRVVTIHDCMYARFPELHGTRGEMPYVHRILDSVLPDGDFAMCDSEHTRRDLLSLSSIAAERTASVPLAPSGAFCASASSGSAAFLGSVGLEPERYALFMAQSEPRKNTVRIVQALKHIRDHDSLQDYVLVFVCDRWNAEQLPCHLADAGIGASRYRIVHAPDDAELADLYRQAAFLVYVPIYEGFGLPPLEAMACGCPVIVSDAASLPEVVGEAGMYADPHDVRSIADCVVSMAGNVELRGKLSRKGLARARQFTWAETARRTVGFYRQIVAFDEHGDGETGVRHGG